MKHNVWQRKIAAVGLAALFLSALARLTASGADEIPKEEDALQWQLSVVPGTAAGELELVFAADIAAGWILYASDFEAELGPRPAKVSFKPNAAIEWLGPIRAVGSLRRTDKTWNTEYSYFETRAQFRQKARLRNSATTVEGRIDGQTCYEASGICALFTKPFTLHVQRPLS